MAGQTYDPSAVFANTAGPTPDLSQIPTAQLQALLDARNAAAAPGSASAAAPSTGLFDDLIPNAPAPAGNSLRLVPVDGDPFADSGAPSQPQGQSPAGARPLTIQGPGNVQAAPVAAAGPVDPNAQGAPQGAPVQRPLQLIPVDGDPFATGGAQPQQGLFDDLIPQQPQDPGVLQHLWNAASRVPQNLLGKLQAINPTDINQTVDSMAAGIPFSDRISAAAAAATGIGGKFGDYAGNLAADRAATAARLQADPSREMVGQFAGGAMLPVGAANKALQGATLGAKLTRGALAGGSIGAVQGASSSADLGNASQTALSTAIGAGTGAGFGIAAPLAGAGAGAAYRGIFGQAILTVAGPSGPIQRPAQKYLMDAIQADGPGPIWQGVQQLGDQGMLADYGNNLRGIAQGLAIKPGAAGQDVVQALEQRNLGTNARLGESVGQNLGPVTSPMAHGVAVDAAVQPYAQAQQQALRNAGPVDISGVYKQLQDALPNAAPGTDEYKALSGAINSLTASGEGAAAVPTTNAQVIDSARKGLDDALYPTVPGGQVSSAMRDQLGAYQMARQGLSNALKDQIPAYKDATEAIAQIAPQRSAYDAGLDDLTRNVGHYPPDYRQTFSGLAPQVQNSRAAGLRMAVEQAVGTKENDLQALRNATQGANGWNSQNLGTVFGQAPVDAVNQDIAAELRMRDTYGKVTQNAETARRTAMAKALADAKHEPFQFHERPDITWEGAAYTAALKPINALLRMFQPAVDNGARDAQLGQAITAQGHPRNQIMADLLHANRIREQNDALSAPAESAVTALAAISPAVLAHALRNYREPAR